MVVVVVVVVVVGWDRGGKGGGVTRPLCALIRRSLQAYYILDELFINGELQESSKKEVLSVCAQMDEMMDDAKDEGTTGAGKAGAKR